MKITPPEILSRVQAIVVEALRVTAESAVPEARLFLDLGAESLDLLDIRFRLESTFGFKIEQGQIIKHLGEELQRSEIEERLTVQSIADYAAARLKEAE